MAEQDSMKSLSRSDRAAWRKHNLEDLAETAAFSFEEKLAILEDLEELTIAMGYERDASTGRFRKSNS